MTDPHLSNEAGQALLVLAVLSTLRSRNTLLVAELSGHNYVVVKNGRLVITEAGRRRAERHMRQQQADGTGPSR